MAEFSIRITQSKTSRKHHINRPKFMQLGVIQQISYPTNNKFPLLCRKSQTLLAQAKAQLAKATRSFRKNTLISFSRLKSPRLKTHTSSQCWQLLAKNCPASKARIVLTTARNFLTTIPLNTRRFPEPNPSRTIQSCWYRSKGSLLKTNKTAPSRI